MTGRDIFWFVCGILAAAAASFALSRWSWGKTSTKTSRHFIWSVVAVFGFVVVALGLYLRLGAPQLIAGGTTPMDDTAANGAAATTSPAVADRAAGSMESVVSQLEQRLAASGGSDAEWDLLAQSYEFLGRPEAASEARAKRLPGSAVVADGSSTPSAPVTSVVLRGEVGLDDSLRSKVPPGLTLFILAKSVTSPGPPVAVMRTLTGTWPVRFELDDSMAMVVGRKLSTTEQVTVEARISKSGQAAPQPGDFHGTVAPLDPKTSGPVRIVINRQID